MAELVIPGGGGFTATSAPGARGVQLSPGSANTKGGWAQLIAATNTPGSGILVQMICESPVATVTTCAMMDLGFGGSGSEVVVAANLVCSLAGYATFASTGAANYFFPISVPAGTRISARFQASRNDVTCYVQAAVFAAGTGIINGAGSVETWGATTASSTATLLDAGATAGTKGSWVQLTAATTNTAREVTLAFVNVDNDSAGTDQVRKTFQVDLGIGGSGSERVVIPDIAVSRAWSICHSLPLIRLPITIPAGSRLAARVASSSNTAGNMRSIGVAAYGVG